MLLLYLACLGFATTTTTSSTTVVCQRYQLQRKTNHDAEKDTYEKLIFFSMRNVANPLETNLRSPGRLLFATNKGYL